MSDPTIPLVTGVYVQRGIDLRGDGRRDLVCTFGTSPADDVAVPLRILRPNQAGTGFDDVTRTLLGNGALPSRVHPRELVHGDFNGDGKQDVFLAAHGFDAPPFPGEKNVLLQSSGSVYQDATDTLLPNESAFNHCASVGDVNDDDRADVYVCSMSSGHYILLGQAGGGFAQVRSVLPATVPNIDAGQPIQFPLSNFHVAELVDLDGDGYDDLVLGTQGNNEATRNVLLYNDGTGDFRNRAPVLLPALPFAPRATVDDIAADDVNGDGKLDLLVLSTQSGALQDKGKAVQILINQGVGQFVDQSLERLGTVATQTDGLWSIFLRLADLDGDGYTDIYASGFQKFVPPNLSEPLPMMWLNLGDGTYCWQDNWTISQNRFAPEDLVDVDGDSRLDFVIASKDYLDEHALRYYVTLNRSTGDATGSPIFRGGFESPGPCR